MTICVAACVFDGIVFAADSATSLVATSPNGDVRINNVYRHGNKVFNLDKRLPVCAMTAGMGHIGTAPIHALAKDLRFLLKEEAGPYSIDRNNYTIEEIANKARKFLFEDRYLTQPNPPAGEHSLEFWIGGFSSRAEHHDLWKIEIVNGDCPAPIHLSVSGGTGLWWGGQPEPLQRLVLGYAPAVAEAMISCGVAEENISGLLEIIRAHTETPLLHPAMPIQDAIDLADFLVDTAKRFYRFSPGADTVGGDTDIAVVTRHERFKWIKRKHFYPPSLNPSGTDHV